MSSITINHPLHFDNLDIDKILRFKEKEIPALDNPRLSTGENWEEVVTYLRSSGVPKNAFTYEFDPRKLRKLEGFYLPQLSNLEGRFVDQRMSELRSSRMSELQRSTGKTIPVEITEETFTDESKIEKLIDYYSFVSKDLPTSEEILADDQGRTSYILSEYKYLLDVNTTRDIIKHAKSDIVQYQILTEYIVRGKASILATKQILKKMPSKIKKMVPYGTAQLSEVSHFFQESTGNLDREEIVDRILKVFTMIRDYPGAYHMSMAIELVHHVLDCVQSLKFIFERNKSGDLNPMEYYMILRWAYNCYHPQYGLGRYAELDPEKYHPRTGAKLTFEELVAYTDSLKMKALTKTVSLPEPTDGTLMAIDETSILTEEEALKIILSWSDEGNLENQLTQRDIRALGIVLEKNPDLKVQFSKLVKGCSEPKTRKPSYKKKKKRPSNNKTQGSKMKKG